MVICYHYKNYWSAQSSPVANLRMKLCLLLFVLVVAFAFNEALPSGCFWDGTAPICEGSCGPPDHFCKYDKSGDGKKCWLVCQWAGYPSYEKVTLNIYFGVCGIFIITTIFMCYIRYSDRENIHSPSANYVEIHCLAPCDGLESQI
uniref:Uncharacterized protein n=1 Tax=Strigamia maritima TaxID=126957 RepID=T1J151_STRMM